MSGGAARTPVDVAVGVLIDADERFLLTSRPEGKVYAGYWEFPGGKLDEGETPREALDRELAEELGIVVLDAEPFMHHRHDYPEKRVLLDIWRIVRFSGEPRPVESQPLAWVHPAEMMDFGLLPADRPIVDALIDAARR